MTNRESGKLVAQKLSHHCGEVLQVIYDATVEPRKPLNDFELGVIDEIGSWSHKSLMVKDLLDKIGDYKLSDSYNRFQEQVRMVRNSLSDKGL